MKITKHIFLTGFMGSGKTTVGKILAQLLNRPFFDLDEIISQKENSSIKDLINKHGEEKFRTIEHNYLKEISQNKLPQIVATGGGAVIWAENRQIMVENGNIFFLNAPFEILEQRIKDKNQIERPLWKDSQKAKTLYQERLKYYQEKSHSISATRDASEIAQEISDLLVTKFSTTIEAEGNTCYLTTVWPDAMATTLSFINSQKKVILLDQALKSDLPAWQEAGFLTIKNLKNGEENKTLSMAAYFLEHLMDFSLARDDTLVIRGGGSLTDAGAFVASIYKRGLNLILIPTTILGAVDAAVGGKTALNFKNAKNQIGQFYLPQAVLIDVSSFRSLTKEQIADGLIEAYKTALLADYDFACFIENNITALLNGDLPLLAHLSGRSFQIKSQIVAQDFREKKGLRDILNLGHTFGHVVEAYSNYQVSHGQAVALGLIVAAKLSVKKMCLEENRAQKIIQTIEKITTLPPYPPQEKVTELLKHDKKIRNGHLGFVLLAKIGEAILSHELKPEDIINIIYQN